MAHEYNLILKFKTLQFFVWHCVIFGVHFLIFSDRFI